LAQHLETLELAAAVLDDPLQLSGRTEQQTQAAAQAVAEVAGQRLGTTAGLASLCCDSMRH
jgi:hypothetical protein